MSKEFRTRTYRSWESMKQRCDNINNNRYDTYGGRGLGYPSSWKLFAGFLEDMGEAGPFQTLERINNEKGYSKENCKWASYSEQNLNRRTPKNNTSGVKGVSWIGRNCLWQATGTLHKKSTNLYSGTDFFLACCARKSWERSLTQGVIS